MQSAFCVISLPLWKLAVCSNEQPDLVTRHKFTSGKFNVLDVRYSGAVTQLFPCVCGLAGSATGWSTGCSPRPATRSFHS